MPAHTQFDFHYAVRNTEILLAPKRHIETFGNTIDRKIMFENIAGVYKVVDQDTLSYADNLQKYKPAIVVHGDDWLKGFQRPIREEVTSVLASYGGKLVEFPYYYDPKYAKIDSIIYPESSGGPSDGSKTDIL